MTDAEKSQYMRLKELEIEHEAIKEWVRGQGKTDVIINKKVIKEYRESLKVSDN